ncbi:MAG: transposase [Myxococcaceae bacterium]
MRAPECGSITFIQRFGSAPQFNVHFHVLVPDGVFTQVERGAPVEFVELPPPSDEDVAELLSCVAGRVMRLLVRRGRLDEDDVPMDALETLKGASIQARLPLPLDWAPSTPPRKRRCASQDGFSLHANVRIHGNDGSGGFQIPRDVSECGFYLARGRRRFLDGGVRFSIATSARSRSAEVRRAPLPRDPLSRET